MIKFNKLIARKSQKIKEEKLSFILDFSINMDLELKKAPKKQSTIILKHQDSISQLLKIK